MNVDLWLNTDADKQVSKITELRCVMKFYTNSADNSKTQDQMDTEQRQLFVVLFFEDLDHFDSFEKISKYKDCVVHIFSMITMKHFPTFKEK